MKRKPLLIGSVLLVLVASGAGFVLLRGRGEKPLEVQTAAVARQKIVQKVNGTGKIQPKTRVEISADVSARIIALPIVNGQWVEKGTFLVGLDRERYLAAVENAEAAVSSAEAGAAVVKENMVRTENEFKRSKELQASGMESQAMFENKQAEHQVEVARYKSALDQVDQAKAVLKQARDDLSKTSIYAPMSGIISALNKETGEIALGSQFQKDVILVIADLKEMEAQVNVDENDIVSLAVGQAAEIEVDALPDQKLAGIVSEIAISANSAGAGSTDQKTEFEIRINITNPPSSLRPGMTAGADIVTKTNDNAVGVPIQSVAVRTVDQLTTKGESREDAEKRFKADKDGFVEVVFCIDGEKAMARQVTTGIQSDEYIEIVDGLAEGDQIVTGSYRAISKDLVNGAVVAIAKAPPGKPKEAPATAEAR
ncbi:MAG TPA: efflux RND transporter periplasmic adaptor subunit [Candidatus Eisenbacteria bacterium]